MHITSTPCNKSLQPKSYRGDPREWRRENGLQGFTNGYESAEFLIGRCDYSILTKYRRNNDDLQSNKYPVGIKNTELGQPVRTAF